MPELEEEEEFNPASTSPAEAAVDALAARSKINDPDYVVGLCSECKSVQPHAAMLKSVFAQEGVPPVCRYCGGVVVITYGELLGDSMNNTLDYTRGIGRAHS